MPWSSRQVFTSCSTIPGAGPVTILDGANLLMLVGSPELVDLDSDGDIDAIVGEYGGCVVFYHSLVAPFFADGFEDGTTS